jgi:hypothetical protein
MALSLGDRLGVLGVVLALVGIAIAVLWPDKKVLGWIALASALGLMILWAYLEMWGPLLRLYARAPWRASAIVGAIAGVAVASLFWLFAGMLKPPAAVNDHRSDAAGPNSGADRAWISVDIVPGPIRFDVRGAQVFFDVRATNTGRTPASNVVFRATVLNSQALNIIGEQMGLCPPRIAAPNFAGGSIFQDRTLVQRFGLIVSTEEMDKSRDFSGWRETDLLLHVIACVDYVLPASKEHHQTYAAIFVYSEASARGAVVRGVDVPQDMVRYHAVNGLPPN